MEQLWRFAGDAREFDTQMLSTDSILETIVRSPRQTLIYLDKLQALGSTEEASARIHHFREKGEKHPISKHRSYCETTDSFQEGGNNERVQIRLEMVLLYFERYQKGNPQIFPQLADAVYAV